MAFTPPKTNDTQTSRQAAPRVEKEVSTKRQDAAPSHRGFTRSYSVASTEAGRASQFVRIVSEDGKGKSVDQRPIVMELDAETSRELSNQYGFVIFANVIDNDCMWHLIIFESEIRAVKADLRKDRSGSRRDSNNEVYEFWSTVDATTPAVIDKITAFVTEHIKVDGSYYYSNATIVPAELSLDDATSNLVAMLCYDAEDSNILVSGVDLPFNSTMLRDTSRLRATLDFNSVTKLDVTGLPLRSDFNIAIEEQFREKAPNPLLAANGVRTIVELDGYTNLRFVGHGNDEGPQAYTPEIIITEIKTAQPDCHGGNFERSLLALSMLPMLKDGDPWMKQFETSIHKGSELSALAYPMVWPEGRPDDLSEIEKDQELSIKFLEKILIADERGRVPVEFAVLIKEGGVSYATTKLLLDVAANDSDSINKFIASADALTDGKFSELYEVTHGDDVVAGMSRVPYGYFTSSTGRQDIENIDSIKVFGALKDNYPEMLDDYIEICQIDDRLFDEATSMTKMIKILQHVTGNEFVLKGFSTKLYMVPDCIMALHDAVQSAEAELDIEIESNFDFSRRSSRRSSRRTSAGFVDSTSSRNRSLHSGASRRTTGTRYRN